MKLIIDCMSGDNAPLEMLKGAVDARRELGGDYLLVGDHSRLEAVAAEAGLDLSGFEFLHTEGVITMEDDPMAVLKAKKDSSMGVGLRALAEGSGDAFVSAGNTGALFAGATLTVRRLKGVHRAAIGAMFPFQPPVLLLDAGANVAVQPEFLLQFADMGVAYMRAMYGLENPRVGLLNNGTESHKGTPTETEAYQLLSAQENIRFVGNVEANAIAFDACDVLVTDGFTGNILLKSIEGVGKLVMKRMKGIFYASPLTMLAALTVKKPFMQFKRDFDVTEHGGSPILGLRKPVIKAHGSSNAKAFKNAIRQAMRFAESGAIDRMADMLAAPPAAEAGARGENQT